MRSLAAKVTVVALVQLALVGVAVAPRLSARLTGDEYLLRVAPFDPIDPFRGAYVDLDYPDLDLGRETPGDEGTVYITLEQDGEVLVASAYTPRGATFCDWVKSSVPVALQKRSRSATVRLVGLWTTTTVPWVALLLKREIP